MPSLFNSTLRGPHSEKERRFGGSKKKEAPADRLPVGSVFTES